MLSRLIHLPIAIAVVILLTPVMAAGQENRADDAVAEPPAPPPAVAPPPAGVRYWTTVWSMQDIDVGRLLSRLDSVGIEIPVRAEGDVSVTLSVSIPLNRLNDGKAYRFRGGLRSKRLRLENLQLEQFEAVANYADGVLSMTEVTGRWVDARSVAAAAAAKTSVTPGTFAGSASAALLPRGDFQAELQAESLALEPLMDLLVTAVPRGGWKPGGGTIDGRLSFRAPLDQLTNVDRWTVDGDVDLKRFRVGPSAPMTASTGPISIRDGRINAPKVDVRWIDRSDTAIELSLQADLRRQQDFQFSIRGNDVPLEALTDIGLVDEVVRGKVDLLAAGSGSVAAGDWSIDGQIGSPSVRLLEQDLGLLEHRFRITPTHIELSPRDPEAAADFAAMKLKRLRTNYQISDRAVSLSELSGNLFGGTIAGGATFARDPALAHRIELQWDQIRPEVNVAPVLGVRAKLSALTSGKLDWSVPAGRIDEPIAHRGAASIRLDEIRMAGAAIGYLDVQLVSDEGSLRLDGEGELFGGTVNISTATEVVAGQTWMESLVDHGVGVVDANGMRLASLLRAVSPETSSRAGGRLNARWEVVAREPGSNNPRGTVTLTASDVTMDGRRIARQLTTRLRLQDNVVVIDRATGSFAGGQLWAEGQWGMGLWGRGEQPSQVQIRVSAIDASDALLVFSPQASLCADGKVSGWFTVSNADPMRIRGVLTARNGEFFSIPIGTVHTGVVASLAKDFRHWRVNLPSIDGELARGRILGEADLRSSSIRSGAFDLASRWQARRVDFGQVLAATNQTTDLAHGRITGNLTVGGQGIRSVNELRGRFDARMEATEASAIPGLTEAERYLGLVSLSSVRFNEGTIEGNIAGGAAIIDTLWLTSNRARMWAEGRIRLADARMSMDVVVSTGTYPIERRLAEFGAQLALQSVAPVATLIEINELLNDRTVHLAFEGSLGDPRIRIKPLETIREEAARLLIRETLVISSASGGN